MSELIPGSTQTSLDAVTEIGIGTAFQIARDSHGNLPKQYAWAVAVTGTPDAFTVKLQGSLDGVTFYELDTTSAAGIKYVVSKPVSWLRAELTVLTNGTNPTVTAKIAAY